MAGLNPEAGAASRNEGGSGLPAEFLRLPLSIVGGGGGARAAGLALKLDVHSDDFRLVVLAEDNTPLLSLGPYAEDDVVAEWRALGASSGLPLKIQLSNGSVMTPYPQVGRMQLGPTRVRRRHGLLDHRRPRFLTRRKTGRFPSRPKVYREHEIGNGEW
jgi:hypothetical protein